MSFASSSIIGTQVDSSAVFDSSHNLQHKSETSIFSDDSDLISIDLAQKRVNPLESTPNGLSTIQYLTTFSTPPGDEKSFRDEDSEKPIKQNRSTQEERRKLLQQIEHEQNELLRQRAELYQLRQTRRLLSPSFEQHKFSSDNRSTKTMQDASSDLETNTSIMGKHRHPCHSNSDIQGISSDEFLHLKEDLVNVYRSNAHVISSCAVELRGDVECRMADMSQAVLDLRAHKVNRTKAGTAKNDEYELNLLKSVSAKEKEYHDVLKSIMDKMKILSPRSQKKILKKHARSIARNAPVYETPNHSK